MLAELDRFDDAEIDGFARVAGALVEVVRRLQTATPPAGPEPP
jgi:hypothetical protein